MSSTQRTIALIVVWICVGGGIVVIVGNALFLPVWAVMFLTLCALGTAVGATALIVRSPRS